MVWQGCARWCELWAVVSQREKITTDLSVVRRNREIPLTVTQREKGHSLICWICRGKMHIYVADDRDRTQQICIRVTCVVMARDVRHQIQCEENRL